MISSGFFLLPGLAATKAGPAAPPVGAFSEVKTYFDLFDYSPHTILQSTAARQIRDPILSLVRSWLEKKEPD